MNFIDEPFHQQLGEVETSESKKKTTVFAEFCISYASFDLENLMQNMETSQQEKAKNILTVYLGMLETFIHSFHPRLEFHDRTAQSFSALLVLAQARDNFLGFNMLMKKRYDMVQYKDVKI